MGGLPEVIDDGDTGFVSPPEALDEMAAHAVGLLTDGQRRTAMGQAAATVVRTRYCTDRIVPLYEDVYLAARG